MQLGEGRRDPSYDLIHSSRSAGVTYVDRIDPVYEIEWQEAIRTRWSSIGSVQHLLRLSPTGFVVHRDELDYSPIATSPARSYNPDAIRTVAMLLQWPQLSTLQLATLLGASIKKVWTVASMLYSSGILDRAVPEWWSGEPDEDRLYGGSGSVWRLDVRSDRFHEWLDGLTDLEYLLVGHGRDLTQGTAGSTGTPSLRHNLACAEIAIRAMECCPTIVGAWGEAATTVDLLLGKGGVGNQELRSNIADGALVTKGGTIIVLEVSGVTRIDASGQGERMAAKAAGWAAIAARSEYDIKTIFIDTSQKPRRQRFQYHVQKGVESVDALLSRTSMRQRARQSIFVADAHDWFPLPSTPSRGFLTLEGWSPDTFKWHDVLDLDEELDHTSDTVINTLAAIHTPTWIVDGLQDALSPAV